MPHPMSKELFMSHLGAFKIDAPPIPAEVERARQRLEKIATPMKPYRATFPPAQGIIIKGEVPEPPAGHPLAR